MLVNLLAFISVYFFESNLFNGLHRIQIENFPFTVRVAKAARIS